MKFLSALREAVSPNSRLRFRLFCVAGFYRDNLGDYVGLLHLMAGINLVFIVVWTGKLIVSWRRFSALTSNVSTNDKVPSDASAGVAPGSQSKPNNTKYKETPPEQPAAIPTGNQATPQNPISEIINQKQPCTVPDVQPSTSTDLKLASPVAPVESPVAAKGGNISSQGTHGVCEGKQPPSKDSSAENISSNKREPVAEEHQNTYNISNNDEVDSQVLDVISAGDQNNGDCQEACVTHL